MSRPLSTERCWGGSMNLRPGGSAARRPPGTPVSAKSWSPWVGSLASELERQARHDERHEKDRQNPLSGASEGDDFALGRVEGLSSARVSAIADLQAVTSSFDWHLDRVMQCDRPDTLTVDQDIVRATTDLHADCFSHHL